MIMAYTSTQVKARYNNKAYKTYALRLRRDSRTDAAIIARIEALTAQGMSGSDAIKSMLSDTVKEGKTMMINLNNGTDGHWCTADEAWPEIEENNLWDAIVNVMDYDTREQVSAELAPCTELEFLRRYLELAPCNLILG